MPILKPKKHKFEIKIGGKTHTLELAPGEYHLGRIENAPTKLGLKDASGNVIHEFGDKTANYWISRKHVKIKIGKSGEIEVTHIGKNDTWLRTGGEVGSRNAMKIDKLEKNKPVNIGNLSDFDIIVGTQSESVEELFKGLDMGLLKRVSIKRVKKKLGI